MRLSLLMAPPSWSHPHTLELPFLTVSNRCSLALQPSAFTVVSTVHIPVFPPSTQTTTHKHCLLCHFKAWRNSVEEKIQTQCNLLELFPFLMLHPSVLQCLKASMYRCITGIEAPQETCSYRAVKNYAKTIPSILSNRHLKLARQNHGQETCDKPGLLHSFCRLWFQIFRQSMYLKKCQTNTID